MSETTAQPGDGADRRLVAGHQPLPSGALLRLDARHGPLEGVLEFSVPCLLRGHNATGVDLPTTWDAVEAIFDEASHYIVWTEPFPALRLMRIDLPRDFAGVSDMPRVLAQYFAIPVPHASYDALHRGQSGQRVQTLQRGTTKRWIVRAYDKHEQLRSVAPTFPSQRRMIDEAPPGTLRVEVQLRSPILREHGITTLADATEETLSSLQRKYFERSGLGRTIGGRDALSLARQRLEVEGRGRQWAPVLGLLLADALKQPSNLSRTTQMKYRAIARELGITPADVLNVCGQPHRLDFVRGAQVVGRGALAVDPPGFS